MSRAGLIERLGGRAAWVLSLCRSALPFAARNAHASELSKRRTKFK